MICYWSAWWIFHVFVIFLLRLKGLRTLGCGRATALPLGVELLYKSVRVTATQLPYPLYSWHVFFARFLTAAYVGWHAYTLVRRFVKILHSSAPYSTWYFAYSPQRARIAISADPGCFPPVITRCLWLRRKPKRGR